MSFTAAQKQAIAARGNVLVVAGAGTGKTTTLVERCLDCLLNEQPRVSLDEILMVTFTEAAAAEMRQRIRERLETELQTRRAAGDASMVRHLEEQLALFETAHIGTLHSFCFQLVKQHFYELELDPQLAVLAEEEARLLAIETLDEVMRGHYAGRSPEAGRVRQLIETQGGGADAPIRSLTLKLYHYMQTRPDAAGWFESQRAMFANPEPEQWKLWLRGGISDWAARWAVALENFGAENEVAAKCAGETRHLVAGMTDEAGWRAQASAALSKILAAKDACPRGRKGAWLKPLKALFDDADFLLSLAAFDAKHDPLKEDWNWVREQMLTLLLLAREFTDAYTEAKRELGAVDFHDLEQYALRLLWSPSGEPTAIGREWRARLKFVFVDEYQDINAAQDRIIEGLSRDGAQSNRFLVGDVKQSIYRFRLAEPGIFRGYAEAWRQDRGRTIPLVENFRSREGILDFVNSLFVLHMHRDIGGVEYDDESRLQFGAPEQRQPMSAAAANGASVELHLRIKDGETAPPEAGDADSLAQVADLDETNKEARMVALRLKELMVAKHPVWDAKLERLRPVAWRDMAVLLRSPSNKAESYAKEFSRLGVPLQVARGGFYDSLEISDLLSLLQVLDNPLQDLPLLAVLRSPLVGLRVDELAFVRLVAPGPFWTALVRCNELGAENIEAVPVETFHKVAGFLERYSPWRRLARQASLSRCLETVLAETHYAEWLLTQDRGQQRHANVRRLLALVRQFDEFQRQGLFRFLRFIEAQQTADTEPDVAPVAEENAVRLMSIHQSKGLEFPVVVVADLGKAFNETDLRADLILDEVYGLCPQVKPPQSGTRYPSLPYWLARQRQRREMLGEELRLLYVAMTRARDLLILSGSVSAKKFERDWSADAEARETAMPSIRGGGDWLSAWFGQNAVHDAGASEGQAELIRWKTHVDDDLLTGSDAGAADANAAPDSLEAGPQIWQKIQQCLAWSYPYPAATVQPAKTSVTVLRRLAADQKDDETSVIFDLLEPEGEALTPKPPVRSRAPALNRGASAADVGKAHHTFLQWLDLEQAESAKSLKQEAARLEQEGLLTPGESALLDIEGVAAFWESNIGRKMRQQSPLVRRELAFTTRFPASEIAKITSPETAAGLAGEFVVVQGAADLVAILPEEIWLVDFKTDRVNAASLSEKVGVYEPQLRLYAQALAQIYRRPVTQCWLYFLDARTPVAVKPG